MSQKNETIPLLVSLAITVVLIAGGFWWITHSGINLGTLVGNHSNPGEGTQALPVKERISAGEQLLITEDATPEKRAATEAIASGNYDAAIKELEASLERNRNDPEAVIYLNNARIGEQHAYTIAASVPIGTQVNTAKEMLRGVAQAQQEANATGGVNGVPIRVIIANDHNDPNVAKQVASALVDNEQVLGVVGHFDSNVTLAAGEVYQAGKLVAISPTSTSVELSGRGSYLFRTVPNDRFAASALSRYMFNELKKQNVAVFFTSDSNYSKSLKNEFTTAVFGDGGQVVAEFDFANPNFNAGRDVQQAIAQGAEVLMLAPNSQNLDKALQVVQANDGRLQLLGGDSAYSAKTLQLGGRNAVGMVLAVPWHILGNPESKYPQAATQLWRSEVNWRSALAYDAARALIAAIKQNPTRQGVQQTLSSSGFSAEGASGVVRFFPSGDRNRAAQLVKIVPDPRSGFRYSFVPVK